VYVIAGHRHKLPTVEPPRPLLEDLQFGPLANFQRSLAGANFAAAGLRGTNFSGGMSYCRLILIYTVDEQSAATKLMMIWACSADQ